MQGDFLFFSGWFCRLRKVSSTEKKCSSTKLDLYYQGAFSMAKRGHCTTACGAGLTLSFTILPCRTGVFLLCTIPLEKYYYECSSKMFLIKFIKNTAGAWMCCLPRSSCQEQEGVSEHRAQALGVLSKSTRRTRLTLIHLA